MSDYSLDMPELKSRFFCVSIKMYQSDDGGFVKATLDLSTWAKEHSKCIGYYPNWENVFLEFSEEKLPSNLKTLLSSIERLTVKRIDEKEFCEKTETLTNSLKEREQISRLSSNVTIYDVRTIETNGEYKLNTFKIELPVKDLYQIQGLVSKISFNNPDKKTVNLYLTSNLYKQTTETSIDFTLPKNKITTITDHLPLVAYGISQKKIKELFPTSYVKENIEEGCCNFARVEFIKLIGLEPDDFVSLDCYTIMVCKKGFPEAPLWVTYQFTV